MALSDETMTQTYDMLGLPYSPAELTADRLLTHMIWHFEAMIYRTVATNTKVEYERTFAMLTSQTYVTLTFAEKSGIKFSTKQRGRLCTERDWAIQRLKDMRKGRLHGNNAWRLDYADIVANIGKTTEYDDAGDPFDLIDAVCIVEKELL